MSISLFRSSPDAFVKHDGIECYSVRLNKSHVTEEAPKRDLCASQKRDPILLREDHPVLLAIDALLALHQMMKRSMARRKTRRILSALDDRQLRDIGLTRSQIDDRRIG